MQKEQFAIHARLEEEHWWFVARRKIMRQLIQHCLPPHTGARVLDIGCGTGANIASLSDEYHSIGVDLSNDAIDFAKARFPNAEFLCAPVDDIAQHTEQPVQMLLMMDVLEHVEDDFAFLSTALSNLSVGGYALLTVPAEPALWSPHDEAFGHYRRYTMSRFKRIWEDLPLNPLLVTHYNTLLYPAIKTVRTIGRWRGRSQGNDGTDFDMPSPLVNETLKTLFSLEANVLTTALKRRVRRPFPFGVSLLAILKREEGELEALTKPIDLPPDLYAPIPQQN